ncbi:hypothetical protein GU927_013900 [Rhodobacteraceae bacterium HSP-20]|uniref:Uncharacterized protein n=1 Tax=Paragemmobacter amnigenus TaxID=2852097 RepID=A0ABS6J988_9RHOB|nr:hypothetical protein [Rhodobacter amnigenus]MBU9698940.1 hypothetical protein [Rhodobacter amnigenus]MBV4390167.1 hypothetical protein [Rhodobacter amnigenus]
MLFLLLRIVGARAKDAVDLAGIMAQSPQFLLLGCHLFWRQRWIGSACGIGQGILNLRG